MHLVGVTPGKDFLFELLYVLDRIIQQSPFYYCGAPKLVLRFSFRPPKSDDFFKTVEFLYFSFSGPAAMTYLPMTTFRKVPYSHGLQALWLLGFQINLLPEYTYIYSDIFSFSPASPFHPFQH